VGQICKNILRETSIFSKYFYVIKHIFCVVISAY